MVASIATGAAGLLGLGLGVEPQESWEDRLSEAAYTSPVSRTRITFKYESVSREYEKRGTAFEFAGINDAYVQENGYSARRYPLKCIFTGNNCDRLASSFEALLLETGVGRLEHPLYGALDVLPFGGITRKDDLKSEANQSVVEVTFWTTTGAAYPQAQSHPQSEILALIADFDAEAAQQFVALTDFRSAVQKANALASLRKRLKDVSATLEAVSEKVASVSQKFQDAQAALNEGMDSLIGKPLLLAQQITNLVRAPARALSGIADRLDQYGAFADRIMKSFASAPGETFTSGQELTDAVAGRLANDFHITELFALAAVSACVVSLVSDSISDGGEAPVVFASRTQAVEAAEALLSLSDAVSTWREGAYAALETAPSLAAYKYDGGAATQALQTAVASTAGYLIQLSFALAPERVLELERETTILNLAAELYGEIDEQLDFIIDTNELTGEEILELPRGRRIVHYSPGT
ncbi:MAG TPA: DNA circularization N-terminal domain-containing protein [Polyangiaceae bacterium]|nr:DNA circularization N-terminal domain-containing protein [Polyangiaceae bacterium]